MQAITNYLLAGGISRTVHIRGIMSSLQIPVHPYHRRASCPFCEGRSTWTISFDLDGRLWHCHRCRRGGDIFTLVQAVNGCDFKEAVRFIAAIAGIKFDRTDSGQLRQQLQHQKRQRERARLERQECEELARNVRIERRNELHLFEKIKDRALKKLDALGFEQAGTEEADRLWELAANSLEVSRTAETNYRNAAELSLD